MVLYINTIKDVLKIALFDWKGRKIDKKEIILGQNLSEKLLIEIKLLLHKNKINKKKLKLIAVHPGPGSYTGQRIGITVANLLAFSLNIPVVKTKSEKSLITQIKSLNQNNFISPVIPIYKYPPHITKKKS